MNRIAVSQPRDNDISSPNLDCVAGEMVAVALTIQD